MATTQQGKKPNEQLDLGVSQSQQANSVGVTSMVTPNTTSSSQPYVEPPKPRSYVDIYREFAPYTPPSQEQIQKELKRQRATEIASALGDGISALANLHYTTQYAPNVDQSRLQLSARNQQRWNAFKTQREAERKEWEAGYRRALEQDKNQWQADRDFGFRQWQAQQQQDNWVSNHNYQKEKDKADSEYRAGRAKAEDDHRARQAKQQQLEFAHKQNMDKQNLALQRQKVALSGSRGGSANTGGGGSRGSSRSNQGSRGGRTFVFGQDGRTLHVPADILPGVIEKAWQRLPEKVRRDYEAKYGGWATDEFGDFTGRNQRGLTLEQKTMAIDAYSHNNPNLQQALYEYAGAVPGYGLGAGVRNAELKEVTRQQKQIRSSRDISPGAVGRKSNSGDSDFEY